MFGSVYVHFIQGSFKQMINLYYSDAFSKAFSIYIYIFFFFLGETSTIGGCFVGLLFREHPKAQPGGGFGEARDRTCDPWFTRRVT